MKKKTKRQPTDSTMRNVRAAKKREVALEVRVKALDYMIRALVRDVTWLLSKAG